MNQPIKESQSVNISAKSGSGSATISLGKVKFDRDISINCTVKNGLRLLPNRFATFTGGANQLRVNLKSLKGIFDFEFDGRIGQLSFDFSDDRHSSAKFFIEQALIDDSAESLALLIGWSLEKLDFYSGGECLTPIALEYFSRSDIEFNGQESENGFICLFSLRKGMSDLVVISNNDDKERPTSQQRVEVKFEDKKSSVQLVSYLAQHLHNLTLSEDKNLSVASAKNLARTATAQRISTSKIIYKSLTEQRQEPSLSIIIPQYKNLNFIEGQIASFEKNLWAKENAELVYVNDGSENIDNFKQLSEHFSGTCGIQTKWISTDKNVGFSAANNLGASFATSDMLCFINSDVFPTHETNFELLLLTASEPKTGLVAPLLKYPSGAIQHAGMEHYFDQSVGFNINRHPGKHIHPKQIRTGNQLAEPQKLDLVTGAFVLLSRDIFERIGGWPTDFLIGDFEDNLMCRNVQKYGKEIIFDPRVCAIHFEGRSFSTIRNKSLLYVNSMILEGELNET